MVCPILSLSPVDSLSYLAGFEQILVVRTESVCPRVGQRIIVHSLGYPDHVGDALLTLEIMTEFGFGVDTFPAYAFQGLATIALSSPIACDRYTICLRDTYFLEEPIYDVVPPLEISPNYLWLPTTNEQIVASRWAVECGNSLAF